MGATVTKPWEEKWRALPGSELVLPEGSIEFHPSGKPPREGITELAAEAPAMWRWIAKREFDADDPCCLDCGSGGEHEPDCEWLRIAKAIGYR